MWVCKSCGHMSCGVAQENDVKLSLELTEATIPLSTNVASSDDKGRSIRMPHDAACADSEAHHERRPCHPDQALGVPDEGEQAAVDESGVVSYGSCSREAQKVVRVVVRPLAKSRQAVRNEGGVLGVMWRRQGRQVTSALQNNQEEAVFPFELLPVLRERLKVQPHCVVVCALRCYGKKRVSCSIKIMVVPCRCTISWIQSSLMSQIGSRGAFVARYLE